MCARPFAPPPLRTRPMRGASARVPAVCCAPELSGLARSAPDASAKIAAVWRSGIELFSVAEYSLGLEVEQRPFPCDSPPVAGQAAVTADYAMAWDDHGKVVRCARASDGAYC